MATTDTNVNQLIINQLTLTEYNNIESPSDTEIYLVEESEVTDYAYDSQVVHNTGTETIAGDKTFTGAVVLNNATVATPDTDDNSYAVANTAYVQNVIASLITRIEELEAQVADLTS